jgi:hypothetical protein
MSLKDEFQLLPLALDVLTRVRDSQDELEVSRAVMQEDVAYSENM